MLTSLTAAAPRAPATHCPDLIISAKSPLLFGPYSTSNSSSQGSELEYITKKSRLLGSAVMLRPVDHDDLSNKACIATVVIFVNPPVELLLFISL
jgi:hypothetical protein